MADKKIKLETAEEFREAIGVCATAITGLEKVQHAQGELLKAMDLKIRLLMGKPTKAFDA